MSQLTLLLAVFAATIVLNPVAERLKLPYPILMLVSGWSSPSFAIADGTVLRTDILDEPNDHQTLTFTTLAYPAVG